MRVLLNTKIWEGMTAELASAKSLRLTGIDPSGQVKVYLVMARPSDIQSLAQALKSRIATEKSRSANDKSQEARENNLTNNGEQQNESWDDDEEIKSSNVTPDLIADTEKRDAGVEEEEELAEEDDDVQCVIVEVPVPKRIALEPSASSVDVDADQQKVEVEVEEGKKIDAE